MEGNRMAEPVIRRALESDIEQIAALLGEGFRRPPEWFAHRIRADPHYRPDLSLVVCRAGRVVSHMRVVPRELRVSGVPIKVAGIAESVTASAERGKRHILRLIAAVRDVAVAEGCELALWWTHRREFAALSGFAQAPAGVVPTEITEITTGTVTGRGTIRPVREADLPAVSRLYNQANGTRSGTTVRCQAYWHAHRRLLDGETFLVAEDSGGVVSGYVRVMPEDPVDQLLEVAAERPEIVMWLLAAAAPRGRLRGAVPESLRADLPAGTWSVVSDDHLVAGVHSQAIVNRMLPIWCQRAGTLVKAEITDDTLLVTSGGWTVDVPVASLARLLLLGTPTGRESVLFPPQDFVIWESDRI